MPKPISEAARKFKAETGLPQSYVITKTTREVVPMIREALANNVGKVYSYEDIQKLTGRKWVDGFMFYASRKTMSPQSAEDFPIVQIKKGSRVVGYYHQPEANVVEQFKGRNDSGKLRPFKATAIIGKWEAKLEQRRLKAEAEAEAAKLAAEKATETVETEAVAA